MKFGILCALILTATVSLGQAVPDPNSCYKTSAFSDYTAYSIDASKASSLCEGGQGDKIVQAIRFEVHKLICIGSSDLLCLRRLLRYEKKPSAQLISEFDNSGDRGGTLKLRSFDVAEYVSNIDLAAYTKSDCNLVDAWSGEFGARRGGQLEQVMVDPGQRTQLEFNLEEAVGVALSLGATFAKGFPVVAWINASYQAVTSEIVEEKPKGGEVRVQECSALDDLSIPYSYSPPPQEGQSGVCRPLYSPNLDAVKARLRQPSVCNGQALRNKNYCVYYEELLSRLARGNVLILNSLRDRISSGPSCFGVKQASFRYRTFKGSPISVTADGRDTPSTARPLSPLELKVYTAIQGLDEIVHTLKFQTKADARGVYAPQVRYQQGGQGKLETLSSYAEFIQTAKSGPLPYNDEDLNNVHMAGAIALDCCARTDKKACLQAYGFGPQGRLPVSVPGPDLAPVANPAAATPEKK